MDENLHVVDVTTSLTTEEVIQLKKLAKYYGAGQIVGALLIGMGALALAFLQAWNFSQKWFER